MKYDSIGSRLEIRQNWNMDQLAIGAPAAIIWSYPTYTAFHMHHNQIILSQGDTGRNPSFRSLINEERFDSQPFENSLKLKHGPSYCWSSCSYNLFFPGLHHLPHTSGLDYSITPRFRKGSLTPPTHTWRMIRLAAFGKSSKFKYGPACHWSFCSYNLIFPDLHRLPYAS